MFNKNIGGIVSNLLIILGWVLAGYIGYTGLEWHLVFIGSLLSVLGYMVSRSGQMYGIYNDDGVLSFIKMFIFQMIGWSITTFIIYFVARLFS
ncbi:MAG: hypothetical protein HOJ52_04850 [Candidatus Thioglobus sp.]|jgi:hypothetical protein|nr:hypothetical protein [Candidatus Thioglobus sp.]